MPQVGFPYTDPGSLQGGVRRQEVILVRLQADAFRSASQEQDVGQAARSFSGANVTNQQTQTATLQQTATATTDKTVTINATDAVVKSPNDIQETETGVQLTIGTGIAPAVSTTLLNSLDVNTDDYLNGEQISVTGTDANGAAVSANFKHGAASAAEVLSPSAVFTTAGPVAATETSGLNVLLQNTTPYVNGDTIDITVTRNGTPTTVNFEYGLSGGQAEVLSAPAVLLTGGLAAAGGTSLSALDDVGGDGIAAGDTITISGADASGAAITPVTFTNTGGSLTVNHLLTQIQNAFGGQVTAAIDGTGLITVTDNQSRVAAYTLTLATSNATAPTAFAAFSTTTEGANTTSDGTTLGELRDFISTNTSVTASIDGSGNLVLTDDSPADVQLAATLADGGGNTGATTMPTYSVSTEGTLNPNGTTLGDLIAFINGSGTGVDGTVDKFPGATASLSNGQIVLAADSAANLSPDLDLTVADSTTRADGAVQAPNTTFGAFTLTEGASPSSFGVTDNYLQEFIASADASEFLARGAGNVAQSQGTDQSAFAKLVDFQGVGSTGYNDLDQTESVTQTFDVDLETTITNTTVANNNLSPWNVSRFRTIEALQNNSSAQAIFTSGQQQGTADGALSQVAVADGADSDNTLVQSATVNYVGSGGGNGVHNTATFTMTRNEQTAPLSMRSTNLLAEVQNNTAINSSAASQEQAIVQSAAGGVDEDGNVTENGGTAQNLGGSTATNTDNMIVQNSVSMLI